MVSTSSVGLWVSPYFAFKTEPKPRCSRVRVGSSAGGDSTAPSSPEVNVANGAPRPVIEKAEVGIPTGGSGYGGLTIEVERKKKAVVVENEEKRDAVADNVEVLWDDGYRTQTVKEYLDSSRDIIRPDGGPPRWFCPNECGQPLKDSPILLYLPGTDGTGFGLILHHKPLGRVFEVRCLHIPVNDRTPFEDLVKFVGETVKAEHASSPNKPIYLIGDSFGGCLALAVAACNSTIDLVVILINPATSFRRSQLLPLQPLLEVLPDELLFSVPYLLSFFVGDSMKMARVNINNALPPGFLLAQLSANLSALLPRLSALSGIITKETIMWKLKLLKSAASYANSRLHAIKAEVLVLASGKDNMLPSRDEAIRLKKSLKNCRARCFNDNGHALLLEDGINLLTVIKGTCLYRRARTHDYVTDYLPPSTSDYKVALNEVLGLYRSVTSSVSFSTLEDGKIVRGLSGVPSEGPVLYVGYHNLMGFEVYSLVEEILREKNIIVRGVADPVLFSKNRENQTFEFSLLDWMNVFGAVPVTGSNLFRLFSTNSHVVLYPGGLREAVNYKGEAYKVIWPDQPEFVRMAAQFGATIVPFGTVGEDDMAGMVLDYCDWIKIPGINDSVRESVRNRIRVRERRSVEVANEELSVPGLLPKIPGRLYYLFGKPIATAGRGEMLKDRESANALYLQVKSEVESCTAYLLKKREEDPFRNIFDRALYRALYSPLHEIPAFEP